MKTLQGDITTQKARQDIKKESKGALFDTVIHDGAPNVGGAWTSEAYNQVSPLSACGFGSHPSAQPTAMRSVKQIPLASTNRERTRVYLSDRALSLHTSGIKLLPLPLSHSVSSTFSAPL